MNNLKDLRKSKGYTQKKVADLIGISHQAYSRYEKGVFTPNDELLKKISEIYNVSTEHILSQFPKVLDATEKRRREEKLAQKYARQFVKSTTLDYFIRIPVLKRIPYNIDLQNYDNSLINELPYKVDLPFYYNESDMKVFAFILNEDYSYHTCLKGDLIIARQEYRIKDGDNVVVSIDKTDFTVMKIKNLEGKMYLQSNSNNLKTIPFVPTENLKFLGIVIEGRQIDQHLYYLGRMDED